MRLIYITTVFVLPNSGRAPVTLVRPRRFQRAMWSPWCSCTAVHVENDRGFLSLEARLYLNRA